MGFDSKEVRGQHVPMISEEQFYKVQAVLDGRNVNAIALAKRSFENDDFRLRKVVKCEKCKMGLTGGWSRGRHGGRFGYYRCGGKCTTKSIKVSVLDNALLDLLKQITPKEECVNLFIHFMYKTYYERLSHLTKIKNEADEEIARLKVLRSTLVEKNLSGIYSDEIFREQNAIIEDKMTRAQIVKDDATIENYNIDKVTAFMKTMLADLGETYTRSSIPQLKMLLGSIFPTELAWGYDGTLKHKISPSYQYIRTFNNDTIPFGTPRLPYFKPRAR